ncbi:MAG: 3-keto-5-aminohexanoate cleavage protein, partial [Actinobacteria bacterium]|nr:3-keto-5-aminohexanoate cleavage protein [Actinomycetota bacterium]
NLTGGTGADLTLGGVENPLPLSEEGTDMAGATERMRHVRECLPEIATIDMGTMNFGEGDYIMTNSTSQLDEIARQFQDLPVQPELECFDTGHLWYAKNQEERGLYEGKTMNAQLCMGVPWGAPDDMNTLMAMVNNVPSHWHKSAFSIGRRQLEYVAAAALVGANIRVGLEDNLYLSKGVKATNAQLVERAMVILEGMNFNVMGPDEVRNMLDLKKVV